MVCPVGSSMLRCLTAFYGGHPVPPAKGLRPLRQAQGRLSANPVRCTKRGFEGRATYGGGRTCTVTSPHYLRCSLAP